MDKTFASKNKFLFLEQESVSLKQCFLKKKINTLKVTVSFVHVLTSINFTYTIALCLL